MIMLERYLTGQIILGEVSDTVNPQYNNGKASISRATDAIRYYWM